MAGAGRIAFQGAPGAFSHQAAKNFNAGLALDCDFSSCENFAEVFGSVSQGGSTYGAIPLENSSIGSISANYDLLWDNDLVIVAELILPVHHALIGHAGVQLQDITAVYSHPAALDQCRGLFKANPQMSARVHWDTSGAVLFVRDSGDHTAAAIASQSAAVEHGMHVIAANVEDYSGNATRFALIARNKSGSSPSGLSLAVPYKLSCAVELPHKAGTLADLLHKLAKTGVNLTKIESRPIGSSPWHYRFFLDIDIAAHDTPALSAQEIEAQVLAALECASKRYKLLGRYNPIAK